MRADQGIRIPFSGIPKFDGAIPGASDDLVYQKLVKALRLGNYLNSLVECEYTVLETAASCAPRTRISSVSRSMLLDVTRVQLSAEA